MMTRNKPVTGFSSEGQDMLSLKVAVRRTAAFFIAAMGVAGMRGSQDSWWRAVSVGILGCLAVYGMTDAVALGARPGFLWWMLVGLATALWKLRQAPAAPER